MSQFGRHGFPVPPNPGDEIGWRGRVAVMAGAPRDELEHGGQKIESLLGQRVGRAAPRPPRGSDAVWDGVKFSWALGGFLASYIVLGEAGKYAIPSIPSWIAVEGSVAFVQYTLFGVLLGLIHRRRAEARGAQPLHAAL